MTDALPASLSLADAPLQCEHTRSSQMLRQPTAHVCSECHVRNTCIVGRFESDARQLGRIVVRHQQYLSSDSMLYRIGTPCHSLYAVRTGALKSIITSSGGSEQVIGFHLPGEIIGLDGIHSAMHALHVQSVCPASVCKLEFIELERLARSHSDIQRELNRVLSGEIVREQNQMLLLGTMSASQRLAAFLLDLSRRIAACSGSHAAFSLPMSRRDIGSFLGLTQETISRSFARLRLKGLIEVVNRDIRLRDPVALQAMATRRGHP